MMNFSTLKDQVRILYSGEFMAPNRARIIEQLTRDEIKYHYWDRKEQLPWGEAKNIKQELAEKYHCSLKTIDKIVYE